VHVRRRAGARRDVRLDSPPPIPAEVPMRLICISAFNDDGLALNPATRAQFL